MLTPEESYLRKLSGLPPRPPRVTHDPDDPATRRLTPDEAARAAHVPRATIDTWKDRGLIRSVSDDENRPQYLELDVLRAEARTRRAPRARRLVDEALQTGQ